MISLPLLLFSVGAGIVAHIAIPIAWFILSRWLEGRALIIASVATSTAMGLGRASYVGPPTIQAAAVAVQLVTTVAAGFLIAHFWLRRYEGPADG